MSDQCVVLYDHYLETWPSIIWMQMLPIRWLHISRNLPLLLLCWRLLHPFYLMGQWPDVSGPCSVRGTDNTKSSAKEKCCLMPCSFKPLSRSNTLSSVCFKRQQREIVEESSFLCLQKGSGMTLPIFLHGQDYKYNFRASSPQVHAPLSFFLDEMMGFRDEGLHMFLSPHLLCSSF